MGGSASSKTMDHAHARTLQVAVALLATGCQVSPSSDSYDGRSDAGLARSRSPTFAPDAASAGCVDPQPDPAATCVQRASGRVLEAGGDPPPPRSLVSVCGPVCYVGETDDEGRFLVEIDSWLLLEEYSTLLHGRPTYAGFYFQTPLQAPGGLLQLGTLTVFRMPDSGAAFPENTASEPILVTSGDVVLTVPTGVTTSFDFEALAHGGSALEFRALQLSAEQAAAAVLEDPGAVTYYALSPFEAYTYMAEDEAKRRVKLPLSLPNPTGLPPATAIDLLALGSYLFTDYVAPARFERVARGTVSEDGSRIETDRDEGIELLTWIAVRPR